MGVRAYGHDGGALQRAAPRRDVRSRCVPRLRKEVSGQRDQIIEPHKSSMAPWLSFWSSFIYCKPPRAISALGIIGGWLRVNSCCFLICLVN